jgi:DNA-binding transcriptional LysR family regulator
MDPHRLGLISTRLHYFQLVAQLGSIRQAARALNVAPSSISRVIGQLEDELQTPLFERIRQRLKLTSAGEILLYRTRASQGEMTRAYTEITDLQGLRRGTVTVAVVESIARGLLLDVMSAFWESYPAITVDIKVMGSEHAFDAVADGECDIGIAFDIKTPRNAQRLAGTMLNMGALMHPGHRLAGRSELRLFDLAGERVVLSDASLSLGASIEEALNGSSIDFGRRALTNSITVMADLAMRGNSVALQTRIGVQREIRSGALVFVPLRDPKLRPRKLVLLSRAKSGMSEAASSLATMLTRAIEGLSGG